MVINTIKSAMPIYLTCHTNEVYDVAFDCIRNGCRPRCTSAAAPSVVNPYSVFRRGLPWSIIINWIMSHLQVSWGSKGVHSRGTCLKHMFAFYILECLFICMMNKVLVMYEMRFSIWWMMQLLYMIWGLLHDEWGKYYVWGENYYIVSEVSVVRGPWRTHWIYLNLTIFLLMFPDKQVPKTGSATVKT